MNIELNDMSFTSPAFMGTTEKKSHQLWKKVDTLFTKFRDVLWSYIRNSYQIARRGMKIIAIKIPKFQPKMLKAIAALGLAHAVNAVLILSQYPSDIKKFLQNLSIHDIEGLVLSGFSLLTTPLSALDSAITFFESASTLKLFPVVTAFSVIALPIAITLLGYASIRGIYDLINKGIQKHQIPKEVKTMRDLRKLREDLEKKLRVTLEEQNKIEEKYSGNSEKIQRKIEILRTKKINKVKRHTDEKILKIMTQLLDQLEKGSNLTKTNQKLSDIHLLMNRKITVGVIGTASNIAMLTTLAIAIVFPISALAIPTIALIKHTINISQQLYMENFYTKGII
ncbi:putative membrane protein [Waddlia chondrophila 2032/99]|uniref:Putative membrane protein n=1 Tax=Waddlia chondrophila 2032/99 TaxID=765953 RepID=F8LAQ6_9BACT|nr:putative membrane protein [Waddlia chondrophila 2032/99]